jgi:VanZ family protein
VRLLIDRRLKRALFLLWCLGWLAIFLLSLQPHPDMPLDVSDKLWHFLGYAGMTAAVAGFCHGRRDLLLWAGFSILMGAFLEVTQGLVPSRSPDLADLVANTAGAVCGAAVALLWLSAVIRPLRRSLRVA